MARSVRTGGVAAIGIGLAGLAQGEIVRVQGSADWLLRAPTDARLSGAASLGAYKSGAALAGSMLVRVWDEATALTLPTDVRVDAATPGIFDRPSSLRPGVISAGTLIDSHAVLLRPPGPLARASATLWFSEEILGVIVSDATSARRGPGALSQSDFLGGSTVYDSGLIHRGLEMGSDRFQIADDRMSVTFWLSASNPGDFARVLTRSSTFDPWTDGTWLSGISGTLLADAPPPGPMPGTVPSPGAAVMGAVMMAWAGRRRRG